MTLCCHFYSRTINVALVHVYYVADGHAMGSGATASSNLVGNFAIYKSPSEGDLSKHLKVRYPPAVPL